MKKNVMMRLASFLLIAVLISTSAISGTYAKYVTSGTANDSARVAKWGVIVTGEKDIANQMFSQEYAKTDANYTQGAVTVASSVNVVAPGTSGSMSKFTVTGTPEVAVRISYTVDTIDLKGWTLTGDAVYCPIIFTVKRTERNAENALVTNTEKFQIDNETTTLDALETEIKNYIEAVKVDYAPGTDLSQVGNNLDVSWEWPFEVEGNDGKDTELGNQTARGTINTITLKVTCTATQID